MRIYTFIIMAFLASGQVFGIHSGNRSIDELVNSLPAAGTSDLDKIMSELADYGSAAIVTISGDLVAPGNGDDSIQRFAISGLVKYVSHNRDAFTRLQVSAAMCDALSAHSDKEVKDFLLQEMQYIAGDEAVLTVSRYLADERLSDPASRVLVNINSESSKGALFAGLSSATGESRISIVQALGDAGYAPAAGMIREMAGNPDPIMKGVAMRSLAQLADTGSAIMLYDAARNSGFSFDATNATSSWLLFLENAAKNGHAPLVREMASRAITSGEVPEHTLNRILVILSFC